jgi:hypothetical protein
MAVVFSMEGRIFERRRQSEADGASLYYERDSFPGNMMLFRSGTR